MSYPRFINLDDALPSALTDAIKQSCWSLWEGCVCRHDKGHDGDHSCDDPNCYTVWTTEQAEAWMAAEREAHRIGGTVADRHRTKDEG